VKIITKAICALPDLFFAQNSRATIVEKELIGNPRGEETYNETAPYHSAKADRLC
jgi:hypothetical protein